MFLYVLIFLPLGLGTSLAVEHPYTYAAAIAGFVITGILRWRSLLVGPAPTDPDAAHRWLQLYGFHTKLSGLVWGLFAFYMQLMYRGVFLQFAILLISAGIGCFALGAFAGERRLTFGYLACALVPTLAGLLWAADGESVVLMSMMLLFIGAIVYQVVEINDWFIRSTVESLLLEKSRKEAEAAAKVKSEFLANMSHELRTPMNGVMGMLELLLQSNLDREQKLLARTSHRSAEALLDILNDILDFSKMSAGKLDFVQFDFQPRNAIEDVYDLLGTRALEKGLDIGYRIDPAAPEWVRGDEGRLRQVLMNLVGNAIKFSHSGDWPHGGGVFIEATLLSQAPAGIHLQFTVADKGQGMSPATRAKLFEPFMQADTSTSRRFGGTGLGLAITRQLVSAMGGNVTAESEEGQGATFIFDIQLAPALDSHRTVPPPNPCRILLMERAPHSAATIQYLLRRYRYTVVCVASLEAAEQALRESGFQMVIAGSSPALDAAEVWKRVHQMLPDPAPPVFLLSNRGEVITDDIPRAFTMFRPVRSSQLAEALVTAECLPRNTVPAPVVPPARLSGHILIAEDNPVNQMLAQRLVAAIGLTAEVVPNGNAVLAALDSRRYRLVLMDCQMPGLDGYETTRRLRQIPEMRDLPIIAMTANAMKGDRELCLTAGMNDYVSKPIRLDRLREVLSRYLPAALPVPGTESSK